MSICMKMSMRTTLETSNSLINKRPTIDQRSSRKQFRLSICLFLSFLFITSKIEKQVFVGVKEKKTTTKKIFIRFFFSGENQMSINDIKTNSKRHEKEKKNIETAMPNVYKIPMFDNIGIVRRGKNVSFWFILFVLFLEENLWRFFDEFYSRFDC